MLSGKTDVKEYTSDIRSVCSLRYIHDLYGTQKEGDTKSSTLEKVGSS